MLVDNGSVKRLRDRSLRTFRRQRTLVHEDGGRHHYAAVVTAEKVFIAGQNGEGLDCLVRDIARKNMMAMVPRQRLQNQDAYHPHAEVRQSCLQRTVMSALTRSLCAVHIRKLVNDRH